MHAPSNSPRRLSNAEIADRLASLAQLLSAGKENPWKIKAYQRAAAKLRTLPESIDDLVREDADLTRFASIGEGIGNAIREIVLTGTLSKLEKLRSQAPDELASISQYPRLDPKRVLRVYKKLGISSIEALRDAMESGAVETSLGARMAQHVRQGLAETHAMLLYRCDDLRPEIERFLVERGGARRAQVAGDYRRRVEVIEELVFIVEADDFPAITRAVQRYGGHTPLLESSEATASFALSSGIRLRIDAAGARNWGAALIACTGSKAHLRKLAKVTGPVKSGAPFATESALYRHYDLAFIEPELREGHEEIDLAKSRALPALVTQKDLRGDLHAHTTASDGASTIEQMAASARARGYQYLGITDHSQSLKIARGLSPEDLRDHIRRIDRLNESGSAGIRVLKSAEVDILADGSLDYPDDLLRELDYTVCSIHSRFALNKAQQTERLLRAMDNRYFTILGHATGRLLLKRPGYEIDMARVIRHAKQRGCFFEINSSPDRLDLSAEHARVAAQAGIKIAISTDAHSTHEFGLIRCGIDQARRAGLTKDAILNCLPLPRLQALFRKSA